MNYGQNLQAYRETDLQTMSKEKLIVLLYRKMIEHLEVAIRVARSDRPEMARRLGLTQRIVVELRASLDHAVGGEVAENLDRLYEFLFDRILKMQVERDPAHAQDCLRVLRPLHEAWSQIPPGAADAARRGGDGMEHARSRSVPPVDSGAAPNTGLESDQRISISA